MGQARIGKVRMKSGGAEIRVLRTPMPDLNGTENWGGRLIANAKSVASYSEPGSELVGYVLIGLFSDGSNSSGVRWDDDKTPIPRTLMPAYVEELVRTQLLTVPRAEKIAERTVNKANGFEADD